MSDPLSTPSLSPSSTTDNRPRKDVPRVRRRNRLITSCLECRRRKLKCDKQQPCKNCTKFSRTCLFMVPALDPAGQAKLADMKEKMGILERKLQQDVAGESGGAREEVRVLTGQEEGVNELEEDVRGLEPSMLMTQDAAYYEDDEDNDELVDLGVQLGKLRITERIGGLVRPRIAEELSQALKDVPQDPIFPNPFTAQPRPTWLSPSADYHPPSSSFFFVSGSHPQKTTALAYLPAKTVVHRLLTHYWRSVHLIARTVHRPSFERQHARFWSDIERGVEPRASFQAVVFAALLSATLSLGEEKVLEEFVAEKEQLVDNFRQGTEAALARAGFLHTTKLETLQAFVMYLIALCRAEVSRAHAALTGSCIRLAECMGLHRDPTQYTTSPTEIHIRRLIWYQICFLDLRTCDATGPRPQIRADEFDTQLPLNVDDADLASLEADAGSGVGEVHGDVMTEGRSHFTDMTIMRMRFECHEMHRLIWTERLKLDSKRTTLTALLHKIRNFTQTMEKTYLPMLHHAQPLHVLAVQIYGILTSRMYVMVLQRFTSNEKRIMPARLRQMTISCAVLILEHSMVIEQTPALADWAWYVGALHQNHAALLLLSEFYASKDMDSVVEARVWRCLDFVFDLPAAMSGPAKTRMLLEELRGRLDEYHRVKRVRTPKKMQYVSPCIGDSQLQSHKAEKCGHERRCESVQLGDSWEYTVSSGPSSQCHQQTQMVSFEDMMAQGGYNMASFTQDFNFNAPLSDFLIPEVMAGKTLASTQQQQQQQQKLPQQYESDTSGSTYLGVEMVEGTGGSPMDVLPDIDWNEWDQLFGTANMSTGDLLIPPFTLPQFSATDLLWSAEQSLF